MCTNSYEHVQSIPFFVKVGDIYFETDLIWIQSRPRILGLRIRNLTASKHLVRLGGNGHPECYTEKFVVCFTQYIAASR